MQGACFSGRVFIFIYPLSPITGTHSPDTRIPYASSALRLALSNKVCKALEGEDYPEGAVGTALPDTCFMFLTICPLHSIQPFYHFKYPQSPSRLAQSSLLSSPPQELQGFGLVVSQLGYSEDTRHSHTSHPHHTWLEVLLHRLLTSAG